MLEGQMILRLDEPLSEEDAKALRFLLTDALSDFRMARGEPEDYVRKNYVAHGMFEEGSVEYKKKVKDVATRLSLAKRLHNAAIRIKVEVDQSEDDDEDD